MRANLYTAYGKTLTAKEWFQEPECQSTDKFETFRQRLKTRSIEDALAPEPRRGQKITINGKTKSLIEWVEESGVPLATVCARISRGWEPSEAIFTASTRRSRFYDAWGESKTFKDWVDDPRCKIKSFKLFSRRIEEGYSVEESLSMSPRPVYPGFGEEKTLQGWFEDPRCKVPFSTLCERVRIGGLNIEEAITESSCIYSSLEVELSTFIESLGVNFLRNDRNIIKPKELDIFVPSKNLAVELNGIYWHSEKFLDKDYHFNKWKSCEDAGVRLIQIWEDDLRDKPDVVRGMVKHKLGLTGSRVFARQTQLDSSVEISEARSFLDSWHIQGFSSGRYYYGLRSGEELVAVMVFREDATNIADWELSRFATSLSVVGGFSRLLKSFRSRHEGSIKSFADLTVSNGDVYKLNGFVVDKIIPPDYKYVVDKTRYHKFLFRKDRFRVDKDLKYDPNLSESELANLNGLYRVYDAGKIRFLLQ